RQLAPVLLVLGVNACGPSKPAIKAPAPPEAGACTDGSRHLAAGLAARHGDGTPRDYQAAAAAFADACECGDPQGCFELATAHSNAMGVPYAPKKSLAEHERACKAGYGPACAAIGRAHLGGNLGLEKSDTEAAPWFQRALPLLRRGCQAKDGNACLDLGFLAVYGFGGDDELAPALFERACADRIDYACVMFARVLDDRLAARVTAACGETPLEKCMPELDKTQPEVGKVSRAEYARKQAAMGSACDRGGYRSCYEAGDTRADAAHRAACDAGHHLACFELAGLVPEADPARPGWLETSCNARLGQACSELGDLARDGVNRPVDDEAARAQYRRACAAGWEAGCAALKDPDLGGGCPTLNGTPTNPVLGTIPAPAVALHGATIRGPDFDLAASRGHTVLLYVGAEWTYSMRGDLAELPGLIEALAPALEVVVLWSGARIDPALVPRHPGVRVVLDPPNDIGDIGPLARSLGTEKLPEVFVIDPKGVVRLYVQGDRNWAGINAIKCLRQLR
ncbi:MAG TPA: hypothetical protein VML75_05160, partial [Kofleriaceae bacterium]|nr:hypothetical protein [Kofleriaceae bacterium]